MDRERAVWTAAHDTISGKISPMIRRIQTKNAHDPLRAANGRDVGRPGAGRHPEREQHDLDREDREQQARHQDERRLGQLRASRDTSGRGSSPQRRRRSRPRERPTGTGARPSNRCPTPAHRTPGRGAPAASAASPRVAPERTAAQHEEVQRADQDERGQRGPPGNIERRVRDDRRVAERRGQRSVREPREHPEQEGAERHEPHESRRGRGPPAGQLCDCVCADRQPGEHGPVDVREVAGDLLRGHGASVAAHSGG